MSKASSRSAGQDVADVGRYLVDVVDYDKIIAYGVADLSSRSFLVPPWLTLG